MINLEVMVGKDGEVGKVVPVGWPTFLPFPPLNITEPPICPYQCLAGHPLKHLRPLRDPARFGQAVAKNLAEKWIARELGNSFGQAAVFHG